MTERVLGAMLILAFGLVGYQDIKASGNWPPRPSVFVGVGLIFTILSVLSLASVGFAAALAVAVDVGLAIRAFQAVSGPSSGTPRPAQPQSGDMVPQPGASNSSVLAAVNTNRVTGA